VAFVVLASSSPASAHPLGNFSVNQAVALVVSPSTLTASVSVDFAELPTLAARPTADLSGRSSCADFLASFRASADGSLLPLSLDSSSFAYAPGAAGLATSRLSCSLSAPLPSWSVLSVSNGYLPDRIGWNELTVSGSGVSVSSSLPASSPSDGLRSYPADLLSSPLNVRSGTIRIGSSASVASPAHPSASASRGWTAGFERRLDSLVGSRSLTPLAGLLAVALSLVLGAAHAALPGHGKTVMAAYLAGRDGRPRDALAVGATVTLTHTGGVLVLGLALTGVASLAGERVLGILGIASGSLIALVGLFLLARSLRGHTVLASHPHSHSLSGSHPHSHHGHPHPHSHSHDGSAHAHSHPAVHSPSEHGHSESGHSEHGHSEHGHSGRDRLGMIGLGVAGGLVPSPTALLVLLGAVGFGRTLFGVGLVLAYGVGMAATLTAAGLLLVKVRSRWLDRPNRLLTRVRTALPLTTSGLILLVGIGMAVRATATIL
jgi:ABC-type nickel/cobalt efflux system permease component RcnA